MPEDYHYWPAGNSYAEIILFSKPNLYLRFMEIFLKKKMNLDISRFLPEKVFSIFLSGLLLLIMPAKIYCSESILYQGCYDVKSESFRFVENTKACSKN